MKDATKNASYPSINPSKTLFCKRINRVSMRASAIPFIPFFLFFALAACTEDPASTDGVNVRVFNDSPFPLDEVKLQPGEAGTNLYLDIAPQAYSVYQPFPFTYRYAEITVYIAEDSLQIIPIDYVGEERYESGNYTFRLTVGGTGEPEELIFEFLQD